MSLPVVEEGALRAAITPAVAVDAIRAAFRADGEGRTIVPPVINLEVPSPRGEFHIKTAYVEGSPYVAVKVASGFYDNVAKGLPSGSGIMAVFDATTGLPAALLLDNGFLTDIRTGAAGAIAADVLAPASISVVGVIGSGVQARHQIDCLRVVRSFDRIVAWSPTRAHLDTYCDDMRARGYDVVAASDVATVLRDADVVITTTPSRRPLVEADWLRHGQHVTAVGSDSPGKQELSPACLERADVVVVDRLRQCAAFGELKHAIDAGLLTLNDAHELGRIVTGRAAGRTDTSQITVADLTGVGFQDTAIASRAIDATLQAGH
jgi:ornithine cyclodeaminase